MKIPIHLLLCLIFPAVVSAQTHLVGDFTHDYTTPKNKPVWTIQNTSDIWTVYNHGGKKTFKAKTLSEAERRKFWEKMWWPTATAAEASCLTYDEALICHVPKKAKIKIDDLKNRGSEYFHYDSIGGMMEISLKKVDEAIQRKPKN